MGAMKEPAATLYEADYPPDGGQPARAPRQARAGLTHRQGLPHRVALPAVLLARGQPARTPQPRLEDRVAGTQVGGAVSNCCISCVR